MNADKNILNYLNVSINKKYCSGQFKKDGVFKYLPFLKNNNYFNQFICIGNKITLSNQILFPYLYDINEDAIVNKLLIFAYFKKNYNLKYFYLNENKELIELYNSDNKFIEKNILSYYFIKYVFKHDKSFFYSITNTMIKRLSLSFLYAKLISSNKINNNSIFISLFYYKFIKEIQEEIYKKYNIRINKDLPNYHALYIFLKDKGYVDKFYNKITKKIIKTYKKIYKKILNHHLFNNYMEKQKEEIKLFSDIDILKMIDSKLDPKFNKKYIKNKFINLSKKYNI